MPAPALRTDGPRALLREVFGYPDFRAGQKDAVDALLAGRDVVVLLPTGAGKSLCYQVPAIAASRAGRGVTLVISPLIALMRDQVGALRGRGVRAAALNSQQDDAEQREVIAALRAGELDLLYVSPERAAMPGFKRLVARSPIAQLAIDEAHCLSQWGHDFRPEYLRLAELRELTGAPTIALTATATPVVMDEIVSRLDLADPLVIRGDFRRPNLSFAVRHLRSEAARIDAVRDAIEASGLRHSRGGGRAIIYCSTRKKTETVARELKRSGIDAVHYHAGRTALARDRAQRAFEQGRVRVLVATNAFGMGIDQPDVRLLVHFQCPGSLEAYYQEAGRAGRDGEPARCLLLFGAADLVTQRRLGAANGGGLALERRREQALAAVERYARDASCRQVMLCAHFTGTDDHAPCGSCDVCADPDGVHAQPPEPRPELVPLPDAAKETIARAVDRLRRPVGKRQLAKALRGSRAKSLSRGGLLQLPEYGSLVDYDEASVVAAIDELLAAGVLERRGRKYPTVWSAGKPVRQRRTAGDASDEPAAAPRPRRRRRNHTDLARHLDNYRKRVARRLKWKPYMVFQRKAIVAIEDRRPTTRSQLAAIPGIGPAKIDRFGDDILEIVRRHARD
jgi:ATP-dependent DNA helicase RecQ